MFASGRGIVRFGIYGLVVCCVVGYSFGDVSGAYVKKDTWAQTVIATQQNYRESNDQVSLKLGPWYTSGAIGAKNFAETHFSPAEGIDLKSTKPKNAKQKIWSRKNYADSIVHNLPGKDGASTYLFRMITAAQPTTISAGLGSDDGIEVFLNGKKVHSNDVPRGPGANQDRITLDLKAGDNELLMKIYNRTGGHGFYFSTGENPLLPLLRNFERDFPVESNFLKQDLGGSGYLNFIVDKDAFGTEKELVEKVLKDVGKFGDKLQAEYKAVSKTDAAGGEKLLALYLKGCSYRKSIEGLKDVNVIALRRAIEDLIETFGPAYPKGKTMLARLEKVEEILQDGGASDIDIIQEVVSVRQEALLANPLLNFEKMLVSKESRTISACPQTGRAIARWASRGMTTRSHCCRSKPTVSCPHFTSRPIRNSSAMSIFTLTPTGCCFPCRAARITGGRYGRSTPTARV